MLTAGIEKFLITRAEITDGGRGGRRKDLHAGQARVEVVAADARPVRVLLPFDDQDGGNDLDAVLLDQVSRQVGDRVGNDAKFHDEPLMMLSRDWSEYSILTTEH